MAGNIKITSAGSSGTTTLQSTETTDRTVSIPNATDTLVGKATTDALTNKTITFPAQTTTVAPALFTGSATLITTPLAGALEYDGNVFYSTPVASARGLSPSTMYSIVAAANFSLATTSGVQSAFASTGDVWTLAASTGYFFEGTYYITHTTTTCTVAMAFACSNAPTAISYMVVSATLAANTTVSTATAATANITWVSQVATTVVTATSTAGWVIRFRGILQTNLATTVTPQVNWSANTSVPVMVGGSYITFTPLGTSTATILGNVG